MNCQDCGTKLSSGICPNCSEELFIFKTQYEDLPELSDDFVEKVGQQKKNSVSSDVVKAENTLPAGSG